MFARRTRSLSVTGALLLPFFLGGCSGAPSVAGYRVVASFPHDPTAYTQGLLWHDGHLYESTGGWGTSSIRRVRLETGEVTVRDDLPPQLFGEGIALLGERILQLTWHAGEARVYDAKDLVFLTRFGYEGEGWGLTHDGTHFIQSDGSEQLVFRDPETFAETRRVRVTDRGRPVRRLNELEYVDGEVLANVWKSQSIARIDPRNGEVVGWIDLSGIFDPRSIPDEDSVLNGIAWDRDGGRLFVTGKLWPRIFQIEIED